MKKFWILLCMVVALSACANNGSGSNQIYGTITGGVESTKHF